MSYHIKRDGGWLCGHDNKKQYVSVFYRKDGYISFSYAKKVDLKNCCPDCKKRFEEIIQKQKQNAS